MNRQPHQQDFYGMTPQTPASESPQAYAHMHQFQFSGGYVMPGSPQNHAAPFAASAGTIGTAPVAQQQNTALIQHMHGLANQQQPPAWAYPTPNGMQVIHDLDTRSPAYLPGVVASPTPTKISTSSVQYKQRIRWETIIPMLAIICLASAVSLFVYDFDRITGRDSLSASTIDRASKPSQSNQTKSAQNASIDTPATLAQVKNLMAKGRFADAANLLRPLLGETPVDQRATQLHKKLQLMSTRNDALLARLSSEQRDKRYSAMIRTITELEKLRPLSARLIKLRAQARARVKDAALVRAQKQRIKNSAPVSSVNARSPLPRPGGMPNNTTAARPPATTSSAQLPTRPDIPNPTGGGGSIAPSGQSCHTHDGVTECH